MVTKDLNKERVLLQTDDLLSNLPFVKVCLMIGLVFHHSIAFWTDTWFIKSPVFPSATLKLLADFNSYIYVPAFFLISGYIYCYIRCEKGGYSEYFPFIKKKVLRLLVPYVFFCSLWIAPITAYIYKLSASDIINKFVLGTAPSQLWFSLALFWVFVIMWPLSNAVRKSNVFCILLVLGSYLLYCKGYVILPKNYFNISSAFQYMPVFVLGVKMRQLGTEFLKKTRAFIWLMVYLFLFAVKHRLHGDSIPVIGVFLPFALRMSGALMAFVIFQRIALRIRLDTPPFGFISGRTMTVYALHQQIIYFSILMFDGILPPFLHAGINALCALGISLLISIPLHRYKATRVLIGES